MVLVGNAALFALIVSTLLLVILLRVNVKVKKKKQVNWCFIGVISCLIICCVGQMLSIILPDIIGIEPIYLDYMVYVGTCFLPIFFLLFSLTFVKTKIVFTKKYLLLLIIPILSLLVLWTNDWHHLFYVKYSVLNSETVFGAYFPIHSLYSYVLILASVVYLLKYSFKNSGFFSKQSFCFTIGILIPLAVNVVGLFGAQMSIYITPITFTGTVLFYSLAILKFDFLKATPIALQTVVDRMSDGYLVLDLNDTIIDFNKTFLSMTKFSASDLRGKELSSLLSGKHAFVIDFELLKSYIHKVKKSDKMYSLDLKILDKDQYFNVEVSSINSKTSFLGTLILFKDISQHVHDLKTISDNQETLMEKERLASLGQLIGGIAHNLKTPIMSISGATEGLTDLIKEYDSSIGDAEVTNEDHHEIAKDMSTWIAKIKTHTEYMSDVITAVKGQAVTLSTDHDISFTVEELLKRVNILMKHELKNAIVYLNVKMLTDENTIIHGDVNSLVQVINNMISNSIQSYAGKPEQSIDLIVEKDKNSLVISVQDYGSGIPNHVKDKLFKEMITTKGKNGTGLGLYMSYSTIRAHFNGNMMVDSKEGEGTVFKIVLPL